ncbi:uncharacterized protein PAE49_022913 isoform 7-T7 [Odontesthes bonariensis]|uniref:uncharacterized protein LOC142371602 isoform X7 n=1 Tax=Odontesthes bonariensis TaxID=219752 RepID=UPI003F58BC28
MLLQALLQTLLVLWLAEETLQGGVRPQGVAYGRMLPARGGVGMKPGGALGALGSRYGTKAMKTGIGRYPAAALGVGGYRSLGLGGKTGLKQGGYGAQGPYGANLGTGISMGPGLTNGLGLGLGQGGKRAYGAGLGPVPGYVPYGGMNYPAVRPGYMGGAGNYLGAGMGTGGYGAGPGQGTYLGGAAGKVGDKFQVPAGAALGQGGYPQGVAGYGDGVTGYHGAAAGNGFGGDAGAKALSTGYGNGYGDGYGAGLDYPAELADGAQNKAGKSEGLGTGGYTGQVQGVYGALDAGLESNGGKYGGGAAQVPYGDGGYPYAAQQLNLGAQGTKAANKYGTPTGYGAPQPGYGAQLGLTHDALGEQTGKYGGVNAGLGNGYKG